MSPRRQRVYLGVMALGAAVLFVDRILLAPGATIPAGALAAGALAVPMTDSTEAVSIPELPFPDGVRQFKMAGPIRDLFTPPGFRDAAGRLPDADNQGRINAARTVRGSPSSEFAARNRLDAILANDDIKVAIINGLWVRVGQRIDGCEVTEISGGRVVVHCGDGEAALTPGDAQSSASD